MDSVCEKTPNFTLIKLSEAWQRQELGQIENSKNKKRGCAHMMCEAHPRFLLCYVRSDLLADNLLLAIHYHHAFLGQGIELLAVQIVDTLLCNLLG